MTLAEKLLALRTEKGLSQEDLAEQLGVSRQSVSKWETGQSVPDLDKIIKLADLFGVTVDELVREGKRPQPPQPPEPKVIYVEREKRSLTPVQTLGVVTEAVGIFLVLLGLLGAAVLPLIGVALIPLGLPLILSKKHPFLIAGWLVVAESLLVLNPNTSIVRWGLLGGLRLLRIYLTVPEAKYSTYLFAAAVSITRGLLTLTLLFFTGRACLRARKEDG